MDQHPPRFPDGRRHHGDLSPVCFDEIAKPFDRLRKLAAPFGDVRRLFGFGRRGGRKRGRGARLLSFAGVARAESRNVAPARHFDYQRVVAPGSGIVAGQRLAQANRLDAHDRVDLRVEIGAAAKRFDRDGVGFEPLAVARQRHFDDERKKAGQSVGVAEGTAVDDPIELLANVVRMRPLRIEASDVVSISGNLSLSRYMCIGSYMSISRNLSISRYMSISRCKSISRCISSSRNVSIDQRTLILHRPPRWLNRSAASIDSRMRSCHRLSCL